MTADASWLWGGLPLRTIDNLFRPFYGDGDAGIGAPVKDAVNQLAMSDVTMYSMCVNDSTRQHDGVSGPVCGCHRIFYKSHPAWQFRLPVSFCHHITSTRFSTIFVMLPSLKKCFYLLWSRLSSNQKLKDKLFSCRTEIKSWKKVFAKSCRCWWLTVVTQSCKMLHKHFILFLSGEKAAFNFTYNHCPVPRFDLHDFAKNLQDLCSIFSQNCALRWMLGISAVNFLL